MEKTCTLCKKLLPCDAFNKNAARKDGLQNVCRVCNRVRSRAYYIANVNKHREVTSVRRKRLRRLFKTKVDTIKEQYGCCLCDERDAVCLDFHHIDPTQKEFAIATCITHEYSWAKVIDEINKCVVVCANCHRKIHAGKKTVLNRHLCKERTEF